MKFKNNPLGWNDWDKVRDPTGFVDIEPYAFDRIEAYKDPQDVQDMFDEHGVESAVLMINREYLIRHNRYALELVVGNGMTILRCAET